MNSLKTRLSREATGAAKLRMLLATTAFSAIAFGAHAQEPAAVEEVVITGTRIQNIGFNAPTPVTVVGSEQIDRRAPGSVLEVLNEIPAFRQTAGAGQQQRNVNTSSQQDLVDLRGLGSQRTLVLVNGRRHVGTDASGNLDTAVIPSGLVERVDVVTGGASAAYGSDAVAGVTNFILRNSLNGLQGSVQYGTSDRGDNEEYTGNLAGGFSFAGGRGHVMLGGEYQRNFGIKNIYSREWASIEPGNTNTPIVFGTTRAAGLPFQGWATGVEFAAQTPGGVITGARTATGAASTALNLLAFNSDGSTYTLVRGPVYGNLMVNSNTNYGSSPLGNWALRPPTDRATFVGRADYDLSDDVSVFFETNIAHIHTKADASRHQTPTNTILRDNPFLPAAIRNQMTALNLVSIDIGRIDFDWPGLRSENFVDVRSFTGGLKGTVFGDWNWDLYVQTGKTERETRITGTKESNIAAASYVIQTPTGPACGPIATNPNFAPNRLTAIIDPSLVTAGCVPYNPFGAGNNTQAAIDYVSGIHTTLNNIKQDVASFNVSGTLFTLPAGDVSIATGLEWRKESIAQIASPSDEAGIWSILNSKSWTGEQTVKEGYVELAVPLLRDITGFKSLDLNGAARRTNYATSGSVTTWKVGGSWEPTDFLRLRATQSRDIRAPSLNELFSFGGVGAGNTSFNPFNGQGGRLAGKTSGNPNLTPEIADTFTGGVVFQPVGGMLSGLRASVDYYDIKVADVIATVAGTEALSRCFAGLQSYCSAIEFDNTLFGIRLVTSQPFNQSQLRTSGVDMELSYRLPMDRLGMSGNLELRSLATYVDRMVRTDIAGTNLVTVDYAGSSLQGGMPRWNGTVSAAYDNGPFAAGVQMRWFSKFKYDPRLVGPDDPAYDPAAANSINHNLFPSIPYFSVNASYRFRVDNHPLQVYGVVNNLLDAEPPVLAVAAVNSGGNPYDYIGRSFKMGIRFQW